MGSPLARRSLERLDPRLIVVDDEKHSGALRDRLDQLAGQAENGRLVRGAVSDDEGPPPVAKAVEHPPESGAQGGRVLLDELRVGRPQGGELAAPGLLVSLAPAILELGAQAGLHQGPARHALAKLAGKAGECLGGPLRTARDEQLVAAAKRSPDLERRLHALVCQRIAVAVRMAPELDLPRHGCRPPSSRGCTGDTRAKRPTYSSNVMARSASALYTLGAGPAAGGSRSVSAGPARSRWRLRVRPRRRTSSDPIKTTAGGMVAGSTS